MCLCTEQMREWCKGEMRSATQCVSVCMRLRVSVGTVSTGCCNNCYHPSTAWCYVHSSLFRFALVVVLRRASKLCLYPPSSPLPLRRSEEQEGILLLFYSFVPPFPN
ncbi:hypothetical protein, unlikely [Trypanosoma brucei gambiense DAL972]|uniref:Uncharacterized protein n=1 Tax=Trypanosoma brucei gambiense (strain MHOM/CI/86/DAL972) TaxID=679716 RepID=D0A157_TRYB9|nr:hypothetical protein, unlikely [Trypanosoma brucei gambiense DAL972]CBH14999.1 hypothetical protein, unlikely [Trypanosoma brucei gambiense DAL972]|eukprot:XP_011777265.1 hypothetical protein, unlikely [Trypanosoma brucei gambiense DAL972]